SPSGWARHVYQTQWPKSGITADNASETSGRRHPPRVRDLLARWSRGFGGNREDKVNKRINRHRLAMSWRERDVARPARHRVDDRRLAGHCADADSVALGGRRPHGRHQVVPLGLSVNGEDLA